MKQIRYLIFLSIFLLSSFSATQTHFTEPSWDRGITLDEDEIWQAKLRARTLLKLDKMLDWALALKDRSYALEKDEEGLKFVNQSPEMIEFSRLFDYFSKRHPIIGRVTPYEEDIVLTAKLLKHTYECCNHEDFLELATAEILSKVLAFRDLKEGMSLQIPVVHSNGKKELVSYRVDKVFTLWPCMPAFGLKPEDRSAPGILLFRGTDLSLESKQGWASVMSDLDIQGPGLTAFQKSKNEIGLWLKSCDEQGCKAKTMGFSLGGVLATYTFIYQGDLLCKSGSMAFNPPGVSATVYKHWEEREKNGSIFKVYITQGDVIPKIGKLAGHTFELSLETQLRPVDAHLRLMCCQKSLYHYQIDRQRENLSRR